MNDVQRKIRSVLFFALSEANNASFRNANSISPNGRVRVKADRIKKVHIKVQQTGNNCLNSFFTKPQVTKS